MRLETPSSTRRSLCRTLQQGSITWAWETLQPWATESRLRARQIRLKGRARWARTTHLPWIRRLSNCWAWAQHAPTSLTPSRRSQSNRRVNLPLAKLSRLPSPLSNRRKTKQKYTSNLYKPHVLQSVKSQSHRSNTSNSAASMQSRRKPSADWASFRTRMSQIAMQRIVTRRR